MEKKIRILQVLTLMNKGGAETMVMNYYRALDKTKYQFDFLVHRSERGAYDDEIECMGGRIYRTCSIRPGHYIQYFRFLDRFFKEHAHEYVAIHAHIQENSGFVAKYATKYGIKNCLCTSHIADLGIDYKYPFRLFGKMFVKYITKRLACGEDAGFFLYGKRKFEVFPNAIQVERFLYNSIVAEQFKKERKWEDKLIIGNVARLNPQKNHSFIIDIFKEVHNIEPNAILVLVGEGDLRNKIEMKVFNLGLSGCVYFEGVQSDVPKYLSTFDLLLFPSLYEGLPVSIIEAQTAGLKCFLSDTIDKTVDISGNITFLPLSLSPKEWAVKLLESLPYTKRNMCEQIKHAGYDVHENITKLLNFYTA